MNSRRPLLYVLIALFACGVLLKTGLLVGKEKPVLITVSYTVGDLPVWHQDGKTFDSSLMIALIKSSVDPESWSEAGRVAPYDKNASLIITQTSSNHDKVADLLASLRNLSK